MTTQNYAGLGKNWMSVRRAAKEGGCGGLTIRQVCEYNANAEKR